MESKTARIGGGPWSLEGGSFVGPGTWRGGVRRAECWVSWAGVGHVRATVCPEARGSLASEVLATVEVLRRMWGGRGFSVKPLVLNWFLRYEADQELCEAVVGGGGELGGAVCHYAVQPPEGGAHVAVEAWGVAGEGVTVRRVSRWSVEVDHGGVEWLHVAGLGGGAGGVSVEEQAGGAFAALERELRGAGWRAQDLVRTWVQVPDILGPAGSVQRYGAVNRARAAAFGRLDWGRMVRGDDPGGFRFYPASTGIGAGAGGSVGLAALAVRDGGGELERVALENPRQLPAYCYGGAAVRDVPLFSRAVAVRGRGGVWVWISGTASIVGEQVVHAGDARAQTEETVDNIAALLSRENFARHGWRGIGLGLQDLVSARVYVKEVGAFRACREVCARRLPDCPTVYVQADICRPELLVEIEGVAYRRWPEGGAG